MTIAQTAKTPGHRALLLIGSIGPLGHCPASGTVSVAVVGIPLAWLLRTYVPSTTGYLIIAVVFAAVSVWLHDVGDRLLGEKDSRKLVWDEIAGFLFATTLIPLTWQIMALTFFLQRGLDIIKVPPANIIENKVPGGAGVVGDDIVAGLYTMLALLAVEEAAGRFSGLAAALGLA